MKSGLTYGSLFTGYNGLDLGLQMVLPGQTLWHCENDPGASAVLNRLYPGVPNLGDITTVDWATTPRVNVLTGGSPCQDVSAAGARAGMSHGTRSNLWTEMREAIAVLRPDLVVWENVRGALSAKASSAGEMEHRARRLDGGPRRTDPPWLRALGRVLGDLADLRMDAHWVGLRASDVGCCHGRWRVFVFAWPAADPPRHARWLLDGDHAALADPLGRGRRGWPSDPLRCSVDGTAASGGGENARPADGLTLLPTPDASCGSRGGSTHPARRRAGGHSVSLADAVEHLLPTPTATSDGSNQPTSPGAAVRPALDGVVQKLFPTPQATDGEKGGPGQRGSSGDLMLASAVMLLPTPMVGSSSPSAHGQSSGQWRRDMAVALARWGDYAPAITRWERVFGHPAPPPTSLSARGNRRLNPAFTEWMMGLPAGHVTGTPGLVPNAMLRILGNGVVPHQAAEAFRQHARFLAQMWPSAA